MLQPLQRIFPRRSIERTAPIQPASIRPETSAPSGAPDWSLLYGEAGGHMKRALAEAASWSEAMAAQLLDIRRLRERRRHLADGRSVLDVPGLGEAVRRLESGWNSLLLLGFRYSATLSDDVESELCRLAAHPAAAAAGFQPAEAAGKGRLQLDSIALRRLLDERPDSVLRALFSAEGLLPCAEDILTGLLAQPSRSLLSDALTLPYTQYNEYGTPGSFLPPQGWRLHESV
ncbi:hypothetical protein ACTHPH_17195 [Paenibacillus pasadenensis]|uniref:hypothetical protein n=1 Tax=Paenibacillus pasadenensis TaxID=217090 RepID=UPI00048F9780|nr:hypothetical protein [Paenibacillus pasadenensis]